MSIKSILRAVGARWQGFYPWTAARPRRPLYPQEERNAHMRASLDRLKGRRDWQETNPRGCAACAWTGYANAAKSAPCSVCQGRGLSHPLPVDPAPAVAPWDSRTPLGSPMANARLIDPDFPKSPWEDFERRMAGKSPVWPPNDDPYAKPEPCDVVQDPGLSTIRGYAVRTNENTRRLAERGLAGRPFDSVKSVMDLLQLIERQEAAERELIHRGMAWDPATRRWIDPDTQP